MTKKFTSIITITLLLLLTLFSCDGLLPNPEEEETPTSDSSTILAIAETVYNTSVSSTAVTYLKAYVKAVDCPDIIEGAFITGELTMESPKNEGYYVNGNFKISGATGDASTYNGSYEVSRSIDEKISVIKDEERLDEASAETIYNHAKKAFMYSDDPSYTGITGYETTTYSYTYTDTVRGNADLTITTNYDKGLITSQYISVPAEFTYKGNRVKTTILTKRDNFEYEFINETEYKYTYDYLTWYDSLSLNDKNIDPSTVDKKAIDIIIKLIDSVKRG